jgi:hypothetical protein
MTTAAATNPETAAKTSSGLPENPRRRFGTLA